MEVALCPAVGDVSPVAVLLNVPQLGKPLEDAHLKLARMHTIVGLDEWVAEVVDAEL